MSPIRALLIVLSSVLAFGALSFWEPVGSAQKSSQTKKQTKKQPATTQKGESGRRFDLETEVLPAASVIPAAPMPAFKARTNAFALIVGVSEYEYLPQENQLKYADDDAQAMYDFLVGDKGGFQPQHVTLLLNENATRNAIVSEIDNLHNISGPDSLVLIYFAGHGVVNKSQKGYLLPYDTEKPKLAATAIDMAIINDALQKLRARSVVIMSDACRSGAINDLRSEGGEWSSVTNLSTTIYREPTSRRDQTSFIFSASSPTQDSIEKDDYKHGLFTYYMLQALNSQGDADGDGLVTSAEIYAYVARKISEEVVQAKVKQVPEYNPSYDKSIPLAVVSEAGQEKYLQWFGTDPLVTRSAASFDDAVKEGRLTRPQGQSALDYYRELNGYLSARKEVVTEKKDKLLARLRGEVDQIIERSPADYNQWNDASEYAKAAFELTSDNAFRAKQFYSAVKYYHLLGNTARAEIECDNALRQIEAEQTKDPLISIKIGQFYRELKKWEKAKVAYRLAMDKDPAAAWITEYAEVLFSLGENVEAKEQVRRALKSEPNHTPALKLLTSVLLQEGQKEHLDEALASITLARTRAPDDLDAEELFGRVMLAKGETRQAVETLLKVARRKPVDDARAARDRTLLFLSKAYAQNGDVDRAVSALREVVARGSQNVEVYDDLARYLNERGDIGEAVGAAQESVKLTHGRAAENAERVRQVAEYLERSGQLSEAAYKYNDAARIAPEAKARTAYELRAKILFLRANRLHDAGIRIITQGVKRDEQRQVPLIIPGGQKALERLSGVVLNEGDPTSLARVFDAALRDPAVGSRLVNFYTRYPEFAQKAGLRGGSNSVTLELPAAGQMLSAQAKASLKFFGVEDKKGKREVKPREFESRRDVLEALGGSSEKLRRGEAVTLKYKDDELPVLFSMDHWVMLVKDMVKVRPEEQLLAFLKDPQIVRLYVGLSGMSDETALQLHKTIITKENIDDVPTAIYFAAPYLRFNQQGTLYIPGQRQGELNWQRMLKALSADQLMQLLVKQENSGALYLFCALSSAGEVGDFISRSPGFEQLFKQMQKSQLPAAREPFDFMDLLGHLRVENDQLRFSKVVETWVGRAGGSTGESLFPMLSKSGQLSAGRQILLVKQIAVLTQVERERPDWTANPKVVELLARLVENNREPQIELALDLQMNERQLVAYFTRLDQLDTIQSPVAKATAMRLFQSASELLRQVVLKSALDEKRVAELTDSLLRLDVSSGTLARQVLAFFRNELLGPGAPAAGAQFEGRLAELLSAGTSVDLPAVSAQARAQSSTTRLRFDASKATRQRIDLFLSRQKLTRLSAVADADQALNELEADPSSSAALTRLRAAAETFVEAAPPPAPTKKKSKQPIVQTPTFKEMVAKLGVPLAPQIISETRAQLAPFIGDALLGYVYAVAVPDGGLADPEIVSRHDFGSTPWGETRVDATGKISGGVSRLSRALACGVPLSPTPDGASRCGGDWGSAFTAATLSSSHLIRPRWITNRAGEFVARSMDLGEDVLALSFVGEQTATQVLTQLDALLGQRRASLIRSLADRGEISSAIRALTPSELYALGQLYFERQLADTPASILLSTPGPLGVLAKITADSQSGSTTAGALPTAFQREIQQFGAVTTSSTGLARLGFVKPEPYGYGAGFRESQRLAERFYDLKLALARGAHRSGGTAGVMLNQSLSLEVLHRTFSETQKRTDGTQPPSRDWQSLMTAIQLLDERAIAGLLERLAAANYVQPVQRNKWDEEATPVAVPTP